jgi:hypothetical protein
LDTGKIPLGHLRPLRHLWCAGVDEHHSLIMSGR